MIYKSHFQAFLWKVIQYIGELVPNIHVVIWLECSCGSALPQQAH